MEKGIHIYYLACISAVILWSGSFITTKLAYETFAPIQLGAGRTLIAALIIWIIRKITNSTEKSETRIVNDFFKWFIGNYPLFHLREYRRSNDFCF
ncbi:EamA family transporter [Niallia circulans]